LNISVAFISISQFEVVCIYNLHLYTLWCNVTGRGMVCNRLDTTWAKVLGLCYQMATEVDLLLEAATTIISTVECSWSTVGR